MIPKIPKIVGATIVPVRVNIQEGSIIGAEEINLIEFLKTRNPLEKAFYLVSKPDMSPEDQDGLAVCAGSRFSLGVNSIYDSFIGQTSPNVRVVQTPFTRDMNPEDASYFRELHDERQRYDALGKVRQFAYRVINLGEPHNTNVKPVITNMDLPVETVFDPGCLTQVVGMVITTQKDARNNSYRTFELDGNKVVYNNVNDVRGKVESGLQRVVAVGSIKPQFTDRFRQNPNNPTIEIEKPTVGNHLYVGINNGVKDMYQVSSTPIVEVTK